MSDPFTQAGRSRNRRQGQAMTESVVVMLVACFCFLAIFQYANLFASKTVLAHAAARAARARAVGFNHWMVTKSARIAAIPASGKRLVPASAGLDATLVAALNQNRVGDIWNSALHASARSPSTQMEVARLSDYMDAANDPSSDSVLDYELWDVLSVDLDEPLDVDGTTPGTLRATVRQPHPLLLALEPMAEGELASPEAGESIPLAGFYAIESHYPLYMENANW